MALGVLFVSFVRAGLDRVTEDEKFDRLRRISMAYVNHEGENRCYRLPESELLPDNIFYPIKELRDNLWIYLTRDKIDKLRIILLINDKRIEEILSLEEKNSSKSLIEKRLDKVGLMLNKLKNESKDLIDNRAELKEIRRRIELSDEFYTFVYQRYYQNSKLDKCL